MALPPDMPSLADIVGTKFRETDSYQAKDLIRDLKDFAYQMDLILQWQQEAILDLDTRAIELELSGVWTPALTFGGAAVGMTYQTQRGAYRKIGNWVYIDYEVQLTAKGSSVGSALLSGLPFAPLVSSMRPAPAFPAYQIGMTMSAGSDMAFLGYGGSQLVPREIQAATTITMADTHFTNTSRFIASGAYFTAS